MLDKLEVLLIGDSGLLEAFDVLKVVVPLVIWVDKRVQVSILELDGRRERDVRESVGSTIDDCFAVSDGPIVIICQVQNEEWCGCRAKRQSWGGRKYHCRAVSFM